MPTTDPAKNLEYVKKAQAKKKEALGIVEYNKINAKTEQKHRDKLKADIGEQEYKKQQAEYMRKYRANQKQLKDKKQNAMNIISNALKARKARQEVLSLAITKANETANKLLDQQSNINDIIKTGKELMQKPRTATKSKRGRKPKQ